MKIIYNIEDAQNLTYSVITIGNFDGVHLAHQKIIKDVVQHARNKGGTSILITFNPHPLKFLRNIDIKFLQTINQRLEVIESLGMDRVVSLSFDEKLANSTAVEFVENILIKKLKMRELFIGFNFHFGKNKEGDINLIHKLALKHNFSVHIQEPIIVNGIVCNSTIIRNFIEQGEMENATSLMDRYFSIIGTVIRGNKLGSKLGFPTINIEPENEFLPHTGVYVTSVSYNQCSYPSVTNVGYSPTVEKNKLTVESYILNFNEELYGERVTLLFIKKIRDEMKFASIEQLIKQIAQDVEYANKYFGMLDEQK